MCVFISLAIPPFFSSFFFLSFFPFSEQKKKGGEGGGGGGGRGDPNFFFGETNHKSRFCDNVRSVAIRGNPIVKRPVLILPANAIPVKFEITKIVCHRESPFPFLLLLFLPAYSRRRLLSVVRERAVCLMRKEEEEEEEEHDHDDDDDDDEEQQLT